ncbi:MAG: RluA family pseudouridine synthase [Alphaproteobacteria bacterium]
MKSDHTISAEDEGIRLDRWFKRHKPGIPHALLEKNLRKGNIRLDGKKVKSSDRLQAGQVLSVPPIKIDTARPKQRYVPTKEEAAELQSWVLHKDDQVIAINKPSGLPVQGGSKVKRCLDDMLDALKFDGERPKLTHRLDRDTSGVLLLARTSKAATFLTRQFADKTTQKTYLALVHGTPHPLEGLIEDRLAKGTPEDNDYEIMAPDDDGKPASTWYRVLESLAGKFAVVELSPKTGRTHQLRVHMQSKGCPIVGDRKYGGATEAGLALDIEDRLHLHAWKISFQQKNGKMREVVAPLPPHMKTSFKSLEIEIAE